MREPHVRRLLVEAAWHYYEAHPGVSQALAQRREGVPPEIVAIAEKARLRLRRKAYKMRMAKKSPNKIVTALARELAGFVWAAARATGSPTPDTTPEPPPARPKHKAAAGEAEACERN